MKTIGLPFIIIKDVLSLAPGKLLTYMLAAVFTITTNSVHLTTVY